jgi:deoxycytidine triphosphate deaminase
MLSNSSIRNSLNAFMEENGIDASALRPASIDLSVGTIIVPPENENGLPKTVHRYVVPVGGTLIVQTKELLHIPATHAGLMFPKNSTLAENGILITNFGCVDPGYQGHLRFVVINLGRKPFGIHEGTRIVTLTLFKLEAIAEPDYQAYVQGRPPPVAIEETSRVLSHDFVDVRRRARKEARKTVNKSVLRFWRRGTATGERMPALMHWKGVSKMSWAP